MSHQTIVVLDFGSQYTQLIARRLRELSVYSEVVPFNTPLDALRARRPAGIILSGGPKSVSESDAPRCDTAVVDVGVPVLGICYGMQLMTDMLGGNVRRSGHREFGHAHVQVSEEAAAAAPVRRTAPGVQGMGQPRRRRGRGAARVSAGGDQRHARRSWRWKPPIGRSTGCCFTPRWCTPSTAPKSCAASRSTSAAAPATGPSRPSSKRPRHGSGAQVGDTGKVVCGLSGGVDSTVAAMLIHRAIGDRLTCIFVDNGLLRYDEAEPDPAPVRRPDGTCRSTSWTPPTSSCRGWTGVTDPEQKRKIIGATFIDVFERRATELGGFDFLGQGTLYPDVIESASVLGPAVVIKSHHNVGGLPERMKFALVEPLRDLFKDEVRRVGFDLGLEREFVVRQPFPGPGLAVRIVGDITRTRLDLLRLADKIVAEEIRKAGWYEKLWQSFAVLLPVQSVGVMGDARTYEYTVAIRAVESLDGMTADWARLPHDAAGRHLVAHRQRSAGHQPRGLRHLLEAAVDD